MQCFPNNSLSKLVLSCFESPHGKSKNRRLSTENHSSFIYSPVFLHPPICSNICSLEWRQLYLKSTPVRNGTRLSVMIAWLELPFTPPVYPAGVSLLTPSADTTEDLSSVGHYLLRLSFSHQSLTSWVQRWTDWINLMLGRKGRRSHSHNSAHWYVWR